MEALPSEIFIPLKISAKKKRATYVSKPTDEYAVTPLSKLLAKAYLLQKRLLESQISGAENPRISQKEFCELNGLSPRYFRGIMQFNFLSPKLKRKIISGWMPKKFSTQQILTGKIPLLWSEQEKTIV